MLKKWNEKKENTLLIILLIYLAKFFMAQLIDNSECYFNGKGYQTKVERFQILGWYNKQGKLDYNKVML